jgi:hypothetical protein
MDAVLRATLGVLAWSTSTKSRGPWWPPHLHRSGRQRIARAGPKNFLHVLGSLIKNPRRYCRFLCGRVRSPAHSWHCHSDKYALRVVSPPAAQPYKPRFNSRQPGHSSKTSLPPLRGKGRRNTCRSVILLDERFNSIASTPGKGFSRQSTKRRKRTMKSQCDHLCFTISDTHF